MVVHAASIRFHRTYQHLVTLMLSLLNTVAVTHCVVAPLCRGARSTANAASSLSLAPVAVRHLVATTSGDPDHIPGVNPPSQHPILGIWWVCGEVEVKGRIEYRGPCGFPYSRKNLDDIEILIISQRNIRRVLSNSSKPEVYSWVKFAPSIRRMEVKFDPKLSKWGQGPLKDLEEWALKQPGFTDPEEWWFLLEGNVLYVGFSNDMVRKWPVQDERKDRPLTPWPYNGAIQRYERVGLRHVLATLMCRFYISDLLGEPSMRALFGVPKEPN